MVGFYGRSLQARLYMLVFAAAVPALGAIALHATQSQRHSVEQVERELQRIAQTAAFDYQRFVGNEQLFLSNLSHSSSIGGDGIDCNRLTASVAGKPDRRENLAAAERDTVRCRTLPAPSEPPNFRKVADLDLRTATPGIVRASTDAPFDGRLRITGTPIAAALNSANVVWLTEFMARMRMPMGAQLFLVGSGGVVMSQHPDTDGTIIKSLDVALFRSMLQQPLGGATRGRGPSGTMQLIGFAPISTGIDRSNAHVIVAMPLDAVYAKSIPRLWESLTVLVAAIVLICLAVRWFGSRLILRPVHALTRSVERFSGGDMSARAGLSPGVSELDRLACGFNELADRVERDALEQGRSKESIRRLHRGYMLFTRVNHAIVHERERAALLRELCRVLVEDGGFALAWVGWEDSAQDVRSVAHHGTASDSLDEFSAPIGAGLHPGVRAVQEQRIAICNDIEKISSHEPWCVLARARGHCSWGAFPLRVEGRVVAAINLHSIDAGMFDADEQRLLAELASDVSFALNTIMQEKQRREAEKRLKFIAYHDPVTELPNLLYYDELVKDLHNRSRASARPIAFMIVGIERLQEVTATFGYNVEGELLRLIGQRLRQCTRVGDILARGAGNNFNLVFPDTDLDMALRSAHHVLKVMEQPFAVRGVDIELGVIIGTALYPEHGEDADMLNRCAYTALAQARKASGGHVVYSPGQELFSPERLALVSELRYAIDNDQLGLVYQPKVDLASGDIAGVEALIRWNHPARGMIAPDQFIGVAEQTGLIRSLTDWVIETVTKQSYQFSRVDYRLPIAINLSTLNLLDPHLPARLYNHCAAWSVDPTAIELEITESALMQDPAGTLHVLQRLSETGYLLYIDDFGTGYSSLGYLKKLAVDALKIDKSFVLDMLQDRDAHQIVRSTVDLAHDLGLKVVAEGVETQEVLAQLRSLGCDMAQGTHIAPPMSADELLKWLATASWHPRRANARVLPRGGKSNGPARRGSKKKAPL